MESDVSGDAQGGFGGYVRRREGRQGEEEEEKMKERENRMERERELEMDSRGYDKREDSEG